MYLEGQINSLLNKRRGVSKIETPVLVGISLFKMRSHFFIYVYYGGKNENTIFGGALASGNA
jgi:hypothetical protein